MSVKTLLSQTGVVGNGPTTTFPSTHNVRTIQVNPQTGVGFSGSVLIQGSNSASPGNNDWVTLATVTMAGHTSNFSMDIESSVPWVRVRLDGSSMGAVAVYGSSRTGAITGGNGSTPATALISSSYKIGITGNGVKIDAPSVPQFTSDDIVFANNINKTLTDILNEKQDLIGSGGSITSSSDDLNLLDGLHSYGLTVNDLRKLADINASAAQINYVSTATGDIQSQIDDLDNDKVTGPGVDLTGLNVSAAHLNAFFTVAPTVNIGNVNTALTGLTASAAELNVLAGTATHVTTADIVKLGDITASAADINKITGFTGDSSDLNKLDGLTASTTDLNTIANLAGNGVGTSQLVHLAGLTENVQAALNNIPNLGGLVSSVNDLNLLQGAAAGTGSYSSAVTASEISYLSGVTSSIQSQLNSKRNSGDAISVGEISGASITITELNYLSGLSGNIQSQINSIASSSVTTAGATFIGNLYMANGSAAAPGLGFSGANTTGFFKGTGTALGISVGGTRVGYFDGTDFSVGSGTTGAALLKGTGFGETDPTHSFEGDEDTGMYRVGADSLGFAAAGSNMMTMDGTASTITIGGSAGDNNVVSVSGVFSGEKILSTTVIDAGTVGGSTGTTALYTVPVGRNAIVTRIYIRLVNVSTYGGDPNPMRLNIGITGAAYDEIVDNVTNTGIFNPSYSFSTAGQVLPLGVGDNTFPAISGSAGADFQVLSATQTLTANLSVLAGANVFEMQIIVMGVEFK